MRSRPLLLVLIFAGACLVAEANLYATLHAVSTLPSDAVLFHPRTRGWRLSVFAATVCAPMVAVICRSRLLAFGSVVAIGGVWANVAASVLWRQGVPDYLWPFGRYGMVFDTADYCLAAGIVLLVAGCRRALRD